MGEAAELIARLAGEVKTDTPHVHEFGATGICQVGDCDVRELVVGAGDATPTTTATAVLAAVSLGRHRHKFVDGRCTAVVGCEAKPRAPKAGTEAARIKSLQDAGIVVNADGTTGGNFDPADAAVTP